MPEITEVPTRGQVAADWAAREYFARDRQPGDLAQAAILEQVHELGGHAPGVLVAQALVACDQGPVVPLDPGALEVAGEPLGDVAAILAWWTARPGDGVGVPMGPRPGGSSTRLGLQVKPSGRWAEWFERHGVDVVRQPMGDDGLRFEERRTARDIGGPAVVRWQPPPGPSFRAVTWMGEGDAARRVFDGLRADPAGERGHWLVWTVGADAAGRLPRFGRKALTTGVTVVGDGAVVPWWARVADGWSLMNVQGGLRDPEQRTDAPGWLVEALGGKWQAVAA